jgi:hypothetical protein
MGPKGMGNPNVSGFFFDVSNVLVFFLDYYK